MEAFGKGRLGDGTCRSVLSLIIYGNNPGQARKCQRIDTSNHEKKFQDVLQELMDSRSQNKMLLDDNTQFSNSVCRLDQERMSLTLENDDLIGELESCNSEVHKLLHELENAQLQPQQSHVPVPVPASAPAPAPAAASSAAGGGYPDFDNIPLPGLKGGNYDLRKGWVDHWVEKNLRDDVLLAAREAMEYRGNKCLFKQKNLFLQRIKDSPRNLTAVHFRW
jgi:hypothetical protein